MTARTASATGGADIGTWTLSPEAVAEAIQRQDGAKDGGVSHLSAAEQGGECVVDLVFEDITLTTQMQRSGADVAALFQANFTVAVQVRLLGGTARCTRRLGTFSSHSALALTCTCLP